MKKLTKMEIKSTFYGLKPDVEIVKEYIIETGNIFNDVHTLEEVEKFAVWRNARTIKQMQEADRLALIEFPDDTWGRIIWTYGYMAALGITPQRLLP